MTKSAQKPFDPFARPDVPEEDKLQLGEFGVFVLAEMSNTVVAKIDELQQRQVDESVTLAETADLLCQLLGIALVKADGSEVDLEAKLKEGFAADTVTLDGLTRAVQHVTTVMGGETTKGNA